MGGEEERVEGRGWKEEGKGEDEGKENGNGDETGGIGRSG